MFTRKILKVDEVTTLTIVSVLLNYQLEYYSRDPFSWPENLIKFFILT